MSGPPQTTVPVRLCCICECGQMWDRSASSTLSSPASIRAAIPKDQPYACFFREIWHVDIFKLEINNKQLTLYILYIWLKLNCFKMGMRLDMQRTSPPSSASLTKALMRLSTAGLMLIVRARPARDGRQYGFQQCNCFWAKLRHDTLQKTF